MNQSDVLNNESKMISKCRHDSRPSSRAKIKSMMCDGQNIPTEWELCWNFILY